MGYVVLVVVLSLEGCNRSLEIGFSVIQVYSQFFNASTKI